MLTLAGLLLSSPVFSARPARAATMPAVTPTYAWLFDDGSGSTLTAEVGGHDGNLVNGPSWSSEVPFSYAGNGSLYFDGSNQYVDVPTLDHALEGWTDFTLSIWIRSDLDYQDRAMWSGPRSLGNDDSFNIRYDETGWLSSGSTENLIKFGMHLDGVEYQYESAEFTQAGRPVATPGLDVGERRWAEALHRRRARRPHGDHLHWRERGPQRPAALHHRRRRQGPVAGQYRRADDLERLPGAGRARLDRLDHGRPHGPGARQRARLVAGGLLLLAASARMPRLR